MIKETSIQDPELGVITLRFNSRAIHYSLHVTNDRRIIATVPKTGSLPEVLRFVEQVRVKLRKMLATCSSKQTRRGCAIVSWWNTAEIEKIMSMNCIWLWKTLIIPRLRRKALWQTVYVNDLTEPCRMSSMLLHSRFKSIPLSNSCKQTLIRGWTPTIPKEHIQESTVSEKRPRKLLSKESLWQESINCKIWKW